MVRHEALGVVGCRDLRSSHQPNNAVFWPYFFNPLYSMELSGYFTVVHLVNALVISQYSHLYLPRLSKMWYKHNPVVLTLKGSMRLTHNPFRYKQAALRYGIILRICPFQQSLWYAE